MEKYHVIWRFPQSTREFKTVQYDTAERAAWMAEQLRADGMSYIKIVKTALHHNDNEKLFDILNLKD